MTLAAQWRVFSWFGHDRKNHVRAHKASAEEALSVENELFQNKVFALHKSMGGIIVV